MSLRPWLAAVLGMVLAAGPAAAHTSAAFGPPADCTVDQTHVHVGLGAFQVAQSCVSLFVATIVKSFSVLVDDFAPPCPNDGHVHVFVAFVGLTDSCVSA